MPVSHVGLTVSHIPSACSFFLSALQPLGYKYVGKQGDQIGFGTLDADFFLSPEIPGVKSSNAHVAFSATSRSAVRDFYASALNAGGRPNGPPASRGCNDCIFNAAILDLDGNSIEVIYHEEEDDDAYTTVIGSSRVVDWRKGIVNLLGDEDRATIISGPRSQASPHSSGSSVAESIPRSKAPSIVRSVSEPVTSARSQTPESEGSFHITGKAMMSTLLGAAAGAAVAYAMVKSEQDSARQEAAFEEAMAYKASSKASSKVPSKVAPSIAQCRKAPPPPKSLLSYATTNRSVPKTKAPSEARSMRSRKHRNFSTTESVVESRFTEHRNYSDTETEVTARPAPSRAKTEVLAIEAVPEPQHLRDIDSKSYHSPTYISLAPTRVTKMPETEYIPASEAPSKALSKAPSMTMSRAPSKAPSLAPTERQIEYVPTSVVSRRPSIASRRTVTSPPSLCEWQPEKEDSRSQSGQGFAAQDPVIPRRDSAMSVHSNHSSKSRKSRHSESGDSRSRVSEHRESSADRGSKHSSRHSHVSSHHSSKYRDKSPSVRSERSHYSTTSRRSSRHHSSVHRDQSPSEESNASTVKAGSKVGGTSYYSAVGVPLPESRKTSVVSGASMPLPESRKTSVFSPADLPLPGSRKTSVFSAADLPLPGSRKTSVVSAAEMALPGSRKTSVVSGAEMPLPESRHTSVVSATQHPLPVSRATSVTASATQHKLPESRGGSIIGSILGRTVFTSAANVPLPASHTGNSTTGNSLFERSQAPSVTYIPPPASEAEGSVLGSVHGGLEDTMTLVPEDSISCVAATREREDSGSSRHSCREGSSHSRRSRRESSSHVHGHKSRRSESVNGGRRTKSGKSSDGGSVVTVRRVGVERSVVSVPVGKSGGSRVVTGNEKMGRRSVVGMFGL